MSRINILSQRWPRTVPLRTAVTVMLAMVTALHSHSLNATPIDVAHAGDLTELSLENLMDIDVYSVSKSAEPLQQSAAAAYVLTGEEIRRAGAKTIPDALRLIPGVNVSQIDAHTWAITARGFNSTLADKLEVVMDGRSIYTPFYSGVFWQRHNILASDIERIEVIRGPGASLWGSNAVNGVVNIVTRKASKGDPTHFELGAGSAERSHFGFSTTLDFDNGAVRVYGRDERFTELELESGPDATDDFTGQRLGFRSDWTLTPAQQLSIMAEVYRDELGRMGSPDKETNEVNHINGRWQHTGTAGATLEVQFSHEMIDYFIPQVIEEKRRTSNLEIKRQWPIGKKHKIVAGMAYQRTTDHIDSANLTTAFEPDKRTTNSFEAYAQDTYAMLADKLLLTAGVKAEHNDLSGNEVQPTLRFSFTPDTQSTYWGAVSRAVRIPNRLDQDFKVFSASGSPILSGSRQFEAEELLAYELGLRKRISNHSSVDIATYYNEYDKLRGLDASTLPQRISNEGEGRSHGVELLLRVQPNDAVSHILSYTYQQLDFHAKAGSTDTTIASSNDNDPRHQIKIHSNWRLSEHFDVDSQLRYVSALDDSDISAYTELNLNLNWRISHSLRASLLGTNLLRKDHLEFDGGNRVAIPRAVLLNIEWDF